MKHDAARRAASWLGLDLSPSQWSLLYAFADWLREEALPAGGIGPGEGPRIWERHIADSLLFAAGWANEPPPSRLADLGSGVGLPGIPLSIAWPDVEVTLLERSGRRSDLARRAIRVLALPQTRVAETDLWQIGERWPAVVTRAAFSPARAVSATNRLLAAEGRAVIGLARRDAEGGGKLFGSLGRIVQIPAEILDRPTCLLIMEGSSGN